MQTTPQGKLAFCMPSEVLSMENLWSFCEILQAGRVKFLKQDKKKCKRDAHRSTQGAQRKYMKKRPSFILHTYHISNPPHEKLCILTAY